MIGTLLSEIEDLDRKIQQTDPGQFQDLEVFVSRRATALGQLCQRSGELFPVHADRLAEVGRATAAMMDRFHFLRDHTLEDMGLLQKHDKLLHLISAPESNPCYVDYSG